MGLLSGVLSLRNDRRVLRIPLYLSALCITIGVAWLLLLPLDEYSRRTYISENAILPGQVHTHFGGSEHNIFRAYRQEVAVLARESDADRTQNLARILQSNGLKSSVQKYEYEIGGDVRRGENVYAVLPGPRADATEAMVLIAAWRNMDNEINYSGVALALTLARYFKRWSIWSKDIIVLIPSDSTFGPQAWVDAYHDTHDPATVSSLDIKAGALQAAVALDYPAGPWGHRYDKIHIVYDGVNGQLPNLDLINTLTEIASNHMGIGCTIQRMWDLRDTYQSRLETMLRGMLSQAVGHASGPHSCFMAYHIDAITLQTVGDGNHDEMALGKAVEGVFRSVNNLLEHLHQSFFFYLLMQDHRFVSIGTYLPSAMLIAINFSISSILLWVQSGRLLSSSPAITSIKMQEQKPDMTVVKEKGSVAVVHSEALTVIERDMFRPFGIVLAMHMLGLVPFYLFNQIPEKSSTHLLITLSALAVLAPIILVVALHHSLRLTQQNYALIQCCSLLLLGAALSTLATLNFSQALFIGLLAAPLSFVRPFSTPKSRPLAAKVVLGALAGLTLLILSPPIMVLIASHFSGKTYGELVAAAAWAWRVEKAWTSITVWVIWWPAWVCGSMVLCSGALMRTSQASR